jgi:hypothetical protein
MATIHRLQRSSVNSRSSAPMSSDISLSMLAHRDWQGDHYAGVLGEILAHIHCIPRPALVHLTARLIDHLDQFEADPDSEDDDPDLEHDGREPDDSR